MKTPRLPRDARRLTTYAELTSYLKHFAERREPFLWMVGRPGLSKSESIKAVTKGKAVLYHKGGQLTPLAFFIRCYKHRGKPIILDDAEHLLDTKIGNKLVSDLGETAKVKRMDYGTTSRLLDDAGVPQTFFTDSPLCVIANKVTTHEAIMSRAKVLSGPFPLLQLRLRYEITRKARHVVP